MSNFLLLKTAVQNQFASMVADNDKLYTTDVNVDAMWETYLDSFPAGTNEIYKERREFDCQCCRHFIRNMGHVVTFDGNKLVTIWDALVDFPFNDVSAKMRRFVLAGKIKDAFFSDTRSVGTDKNHSEGEDGAVLTWEHFYLDLPMSAVTHKDNIPSRKGQIRDSKNVFKRSLDELTLDAGNTIRELIDQGSLYRGAEHRSAIMGFLLAKAQYDKIPDARKDNWCWGASQSSSIARIRNTAIGTLLINLSEGMDLNVAVGKFEAVVAPTNYKRPKAIFTAAMVKKAEQTLTNLGYLDSLGRRHAKMDDITVNDVLFLNRHAKKEAITVFDELANSSGATAQSYDKVEEVNIDQFIGNILPNATSVQLLVENRHEGNLATLIAPQNADARSMFKWDNNFSWSYNGDIADSMKQRVKAAGGKVDGALRFSIQWNDDGQNRNDFDAHCTEPGGNTIMFSNMNNFSTKGNLDVDITRPGNKVAVENITWPDKRLMDEGLYLFQVHNYSHNGGRTGFTAEIEYEGEVYSYSYNKELRSGEKVEVAQLQFSKTDGIKFTRSLDSTKTQKELWGIKTNSFVDVSSIMRSPNHWDGEDGLGNEHYFFFLNGCMNTANPRGFYNEFLRQSLLEHKHVFEALGSKMRVEHNNDQLSGLGFSTTQRNSVIAKVEGSFNRVIKINF